MGTASSVDTGIEIRGSAIDKHGVYALRAFRAGDVVLRWDTSHRLSREQSATYRQDPDTHLHPFNANEFFVVKSPECFVNHSCDNNTVALNFMDVAVRNIQPGDEITSNYETDGAGLSFACQCGALNCRGVVGKSTADRSPPHA